MVQYDQESIKIRLIESFSRYYTQSTGDDKNLFYATKERIFDLVAEELAGAMQYDEYMTRETKWDLAQNPSSLLSQATFYNYDAHRKIGSYGAIRVSSSPMFNGAWPQNIRIPKYSIFSDGEIKFATTQERILDNTSDYIDIDVIQGIPKTFILEITAAQFSSEFDYLKIKIEGESIENKLYDVFVNGVIWEQIDHLRLSEGGDSQVYTLNNNVDFTGIEIEFGNGVFGQALTVGDVVTFKYLETKGEKGNVLKLGSISVVEDAFLDATNNPVIIYSSNFDALIGGDARESMDSIRANAPKSYQSGERAVTRADYESLILKEGYADKVIVWGENEVNQDLGNPPGTYIPKEENLVYISGFNIDPVTFLGINLTPSQQDTIRIFLNERKPPTDILNFTDTEFLYITFHSQLYVSDKSFTEELVRANVIADLSENYSLENGQFKKNLYFSNYYEFIQSVEGIDHHITEISFSSITFFKSAYVFNLELNINNIKPLSVKIYVRDNQGANVWIHIASDDGIGNLAGEPIDPDDLGQGYYRLPDATINYADGYGGDITVTFGLDSEFSYYEIRTDYEVSDVEEGNLILTKRQQIFAYYATDLNVVFMDTTQEN